MTWIRVEPDEMAAVSGALQRTAAELTGVRTGVRHDCSTCLPTQADVIAHAALALVDQILTLVAVDLLLQAVDLLQRGGVASADSLTVAATATASDMSLVGANTSSTFGSSPLVGGLVLGGGEGTFTSTSLTSGPAVGGGLVLGGGASTSGGPSLSSGAAMGGGLFLGATSPDAPIFGSPIGWTGPSPSEAWGPIGSGTGAGSGVALGSMGNPYIAPKPWELMDSDLDGVLNGQDRNPRLDDRKNTDRVGLPDAFDRHKYDPNRG